MSPVCRLNCRVKCGWSAKPHAKPTTPGATRVSARSRPAAATRALRTTPGNVAPAAARRRWSVRGAGGAVTEVEPYMGMAAHAVVLRADGRVFVHLHPAGTVSMAAQARLLRRERGDAVLDGAAQPAAADAPHAAHGAATYPGELAFPFAFPTPGAYRVWVQVRHGGRVRTAAFNVVAA